MNLGEAPNYVNRVLAGFGVRLARAPRAADRRRRLLMQARSVERVIDIGANSGQYARKIRSLGYRGLIDSYEPLPSAFSELQLRAKHDARWRTFQLAVGRSQHRLKLNVAGNSVSSSPLEMAKRHTDAEPQSRIVSTVDVECTTLDQIMESLPTQGMMLKVDTQGYESEVLAGGKSSLKKLQLIELELSLVELYVGQPLFRELDAILVGNGFALASLAEGFWDGRTGELLQMDAIYARSPAK